MFTEARSNRMLPLIATFVFVLTGTGRALAQDMHPHMQMQDGTAVAQMQLDAGKKWPTDASLRSGMAAIRRAFDADHPAIHAGKETDAQYDALAAKIEAQVNDIVKNCRLPPAPDANLHHVVADLLQGVSLMRGNDAARSRHDGAALVHGALIAYGRYFDDPGWTP
ncbi:MAG: hypothetical protein FIB04_08105 [Gammaproteobacteria bacterium]|nr:hypothetical protein [Gammaproteobacteria bacterium]